MKKEKKERLEKAGWRVGSAQNFLELSDVEMALIEIRVALSAALRERRTKHHLSQAALADRIGSSQSRVAKMEAGDPSVSIDLLLRSLVLTGSSIGDIGKAIATRDSSRSSHARKSA